MKVKDKNFSPANELLLNATSLNPYITDGKFTENDWDLTVKSARVQGVVLIAAETIVKNKNNLSAKTYGKFMNAVGSLLSRNDVVYKAQADLLKVFDGKIDCLVLKGLSSAVYYDKPENRIMGDIDLLIRETDLEKADQLLLSDGYEKQKGEEIYDVVYSKNGVMVELHFAIPGIPDGEYGEQIKSFMADVFDTAVIREFQGQKFRSPDDAHNAVIMLLHLQHHLYYGLVWLKQIVDWSRFIKATDGAPFWGQTVLPLFKSVDLLVFASALTNACGKYLNSPVPLWAQAFNEGDEIIDAVFNSEKVTLSGDDYTKADMVLSEERYRKRNRFALAINYVHKKTVNVPCVKKVVVLYPFIYVYESFVCLIKALFTRRKNFKQINDFSKNTKKIYDKYGVFRNNKW